MAYHYDISANKVHYIPYGMADSDAKVVWDKGDAGLNYRKRLDGTFVLYRSGNEPLYDAIMASDHCADWFISMLDHNDNLVVKSRFNKRDIEYNVDKCNIVIKPRYYDPYGIDAVLEKDYNIINDTLQKLTVSYNAAFQFEFLTCSATNVNVPDLQWHVSGFWYSIVPMKIPVLKVFCGQGDYTGFNTQDNGWTWYSQHNVYLETSQ